MGDMGIKVDVVEVEKWINCCDRLLRSGRGNTQEFTEARAKAIEALRQRVHVALPDPPPPPIKQPTAPPASPVPPIRDRPVRPKLRRQWPDDDAPPEEWQEYLDTLALAGEEGSPEYIAARYRLEKSTRVEQVSEEKVRRAPEAIYHPNGAIPHNWPIILWSGRQRAHHKWLGDEKEEGYNFYCHEGRSAK